VNQSLYRENRTLSSGCPNTQARAAGVSPPWVLETHLQERCRKVAVDCHRCAHERWCSRGRKPTGGLRPPLLRCGANVCQRKTVFFDAQTRNPKELLASARRGSVNRTLYRENRTLSSGCRTRTQERRASARRGCANAHRRTRAPFTADRQRCVCMCVDDRCIRGNRYHGGLTPPALALQSACSSAKNDFFDAQTRNPKERLASARRGSVNRTCNGERFSRSDYIHHAGSDGAPRLAYASRSWCATSVRR
jgi:hypothetical protein